MRSSNTWAKNYMYTKILEIGALWCAKERVHCILHFRNSLVNTPPPPKKKKKKKKNELGYQVWNLGQGRLI